MASPGGVVIVGGGIVGLTAANYLLDKGQKVTLVEKCAIGCHSSGKAGGFLTDGDSGWHRGPFVKIAKHSFALHEQLAKQFGADTIGYRRVKCIGRGSGNATSPQWLQAGFQNPMGDQTGMAQVSPLKLMEALSNAATSNGMQLIIGKAVGVDRSDDVVTAVRIQQAGEEEVTLPCSSVILSMGPWARDAASWFPESTMPRDTVSSRYTSVIWDDVEIGKAATMVFVSDEHHVEIYPRGDECYANGCPTTTELPDNPLDIVPPEQTIEDVKAETIGSVSRLKDASVLRTTACFLAGSEDSKPVIGLVPKVKNAVIACGGGCWGITNGPAMGQAAANLVLDEKPAFDLKPFDPVRFERGASEIGASGLPPKLLALLAENPQLAEMMRQHPEQVAQLLNMFGDEDD